MRRTIATLALALGAASLLAGCGGGGSKSTTTSTTTTSTTTTTTTAATSTVATVLSKAAYAKRMRAIGQGLSNSIGTVDSSSAAAAKTSLAKVQEDLRAAQKQLESITPPADVAGPHRNLAAAVGEFADELDPIIKQLGAGNLAALQTVTTLGALQKIATATSAITKAGYTIT